MLLLSIDGFHQFDLANYIARIRRRRSPARRPRHALHEHDFVAAVRFVPRDPGDDHGRLARVDGHLLRRDVGRQPVAAGIRRAPRAARLPRSTVRPTSTTRSSTTSIDPAKFPLDPDHGCSLVYPHDYLKVNTIFEVIKAGGCRTAVTDKHPTYELLNGPSGTGVDDLFTPENDANGAKKNIAKMEAYDATKVQAVLN